MSDTTMDDIKNGKGLTPLVSQSQAKSDAHPSGITTESRDTHGITHEIFTLNDQKKDGNK